MAFTMTRDDVAGVRAKVENLRIRAKDAALRHRHIDRVLADRYFCERVCYEKLSACLKEERPDARPRATSRLEHDPFPLVVLRKVDDEGVERFDFGCVAHDLVIEAAVKAANTSFRLEDYNAAIVSDDDMGPWDRLDAAWQRLWYIAQKRPKK